MPQFPILTKRKLMQNYDRIVTKRRGSLTSVSV